MMTAPKPSRAMQERILETADRLFYGQGIRAVGVDTIAAEVGISKRTLYNHYPSKDELIVAYLSRRLRPVPTTDQPPAEQILGNFERLERAFAAAVPRLSVRQRGGRAQGAGACRQQDRVRLQGAAPPVVPRAAGAAHVEDPDRLAMQLLILVDGAIAAALVRGDPRSP